jgi:hypothetical protein
LYRYITAMAWAAAAVATAAALALALPPLLGPASPLQAAGHPLASLSVKWALTCVAGLAAAARVLLARLADQFVHGGAVHVECSCQ